jgi:hypothetical protein
MPHTDESLVTQAEVQDLARIMTIKYGSQLRGRVFAITIKTDSAAAYVTTTLHNSERSFVYPVEARMAHKEQNISAKDALLMLVDYTDHYFDEFFHSDENVFLPIDWQTYMYENLDLQMRGQMLNEKAQHEADALLVTSGMGEHEE